MLEPGQLTFDEESSGIIDAHRVVGPRWFLFDIQVHRLSSDTGTRAGRASCSPCASTRWKDVYDIGG